MQHEYEKPRMEPLEVVCRDCGRGDCCAGAPAT